MLLELLLLLVFPPLECIGRFGWPLRLLSLKLLSLGTVDWKPELLLLRRPLMYWPDVRLDPSSVPSKSEL